MGRRRNTKSQGRGRPTVGKRGGSKQSSSLPNNQCNDSSFLSKLGDIVIDAPLEYEIGTRVEFPNLNGYGEEGSIQTGTIAAHWARRDHWPDDKYAPYAVMLDDGLVIYSHRTDKDFIRLSDSQPMQVEFNVGARVECLLEIEGGDHDDETKWFPGTIIERHLDWYNDPFNQPPYIIKYDYGRERPFWGPPDHIRASKVKKNAKGKTLRFDVGERVECHVGDDNWETGEVVKLWYREDDSFEDGYVVPYQVLLDDTGDLIFAPTDEDSCIRKTNKQKPPLRFEVGDTVECTVDGGWVAGIVARTHYREKDFKRTDRTVPYQVKLTEAAYAGDYLYAPLDNDLYIRRVINKPRRFKTNDRVLCHVGEDDWQPGSVLKTNVRDTEGAIVPYNVQLDDGDMCWVPEDDDSYIRKSATPLICRGMNTAFVHVMSRLLIYNEEYDEATDMLEERIALTRLKIQESDEEVASVLNDDLSQLLIYLSEAHQAKGCLNEMELALNAALLLTEVSQHGKTKKHRLLSITSKLATHAALSGKKYDALKFSEEAIPLIRETTGGHDSFRLGLTLLQCGKLNVGCNDKERGLSQMSEGVAILTRLYGEDNKSVMLAKKDLDAMQLNAEIEAEVFVSK